MAEFDVDLFVIGAGSGGTRAARIAAGHGARADAELSIAGAVGATAQGQGADHGSRQHQGFAALQSVLDHF